MVIKVCYHAHLSNKKEFWYKSSKNVFFIFYFFRNKQKSLFTRFQPINTKFISIIIGRVNSFPSNYNVHQNLENLLSILLNIPIHIPCNSHNPSLRHPRPPPRLRFPKGNPSQQHRLLHPLPIWLLHPPSPIPLLRSLLRSISLLRHPRHRNPHLRFRFRRVWYSGQDALHLAPCYRDGS